MSLLPNVKEFKQIKQLHEVDPHTRLLMIDYQKAVKAYRYNQAELSDVKLLKTLDHFPGLGNVLGEIGSAEDVATVQANLNEAKDKLKQTLDAVLASHISDDLKQYLLTDYEELISESSGDSTVMTTIFKVIPSIMKLKGK